MMFDLYGYNFQDCVWRVTVSVQEKSAQVGLEYELGVK
jgi:hypothetical protein